MPRPDPERDTPAARRRKVAFRLVMAGIVVLLIGGWKLLYNGYVVDAGYEPEHTLGTAIPLLLAGAGLVIGGIWHVLGRDEPPDE